MGLISKTKEIFSGEEQEEDEDIDVDDMFAEEGEVGEGSSGEGGDDLIGEEEPEEEEEDEVMEWESAYDFAEWWLEEEGFASLHEFGEKAMMMRLQNSPMYRDRIETGLNTLQTINEAKQHMEQIKGEDNSDRDYSQMADKIEDANRLIEGTRSLSGEDEMIVQQGMGLARSAIEAIGGTVEKTTGNVDSKMERKGGEI